MKTLKRTSVVRVTLCAAAAMTAAVLSAPASAQSSRIPARIGILPFADATSSGNRTVGADVGRTMQAEMTQSTNFVARMLPVDGTSSDMLDRDTAVAIGRAQKVSMVFMGTVLEARSEESKRGGWLPSFKGQSGSVSIRSINAEVRLQGELYDVGSGRLLSTFRVTGRHADKKFGGTAFTTFGSWGRDEYSTFLTSPMGKALQDAIAQLVQKVAVNASQAAAQP